MPREPEVLGSRVDVVLRVYVWFCCIKYHLYYYNNEDVDDCEDDIWGSGKEMT